MGGSIQNWRVGIATVFSVALILGAYLLARGFSTPPVAQASTESALLQAIATKDSDHDGLPDWEESLYGTDPSNPDTFHLGMTDGEAVARGLIVPKAVADIAVATSTPSAPVTGGPPPAAAGSLTDAFAKNFFTLYVSAKQTNGGSPLSKDQVNALATQAFQNLAASIAPAPDFKQASDLTVSGSGPDALRAYALAAENVLRVQSATLPKSELQYLQDAVGGDATATGHIYELAKAYRNVATGLAAVPVPSELAGTSLALINAMARISQTSSDFANFNADPVTAMLALKQYASAVLALGNALQAVSTIYASAGVTFAPGAPGSAFVSVMQGISTATSTTP